MQSEAEDDKTGSREDRASQGSRTRRAQPRSGLKGNSSHKKSTMRKTYVAMALLVLLICQLLTETMAAADEGADVENSIHALVKRRSYMAPGFYKKYPYGWKAKGRYKKKKGGKKKKKAKGKYYRRYYKKYYKKHH